MHEIQINISQKEHVFTERATACLPTTTLYYLLRVSYFLL